MLRSLVRRLLDTPREGARIHESMRRLLAQNVRSVRELLDVGVGDGDATKLYADIWNIPYAQVSTVEPQEQYKKILPFKNASLDVEKDLLPFKDEAFDLVVCNQVLEHLKVLRPAVSELARVVKVGGHLALGIPNLSSLIARLQLLVGRDPICISFPGPHFRGYTYRSFLRFLALNPNFRLVATSGSSLYPLPVPLMEPAARLLPGFACYTFYLLEKIAHRPERDWKDVPYIGSDITG